jgi:hypothetical protein
MTRTQIYYQYESAAYPEKIAKTLMQGWFADRCNAQNAAYLSNNLVLILQSSSNLAAFIGNFDRISSQRFAARLSSDQIGGLTISDAARFF